MRTLFVIIGNLTAACCFVAGVFVLSPLLAAAGVLTFAAVVGLEVVLERIGKFDLLLQQIGGVRRDLADIRRTLAAKESVKETREMSPEELMAAAYLTDDDDAK